MPRGNLMLWVQMNPNGKEREINWPQEVGWVENFEVEIVSVNLILIYFSSRISRKSEKNCSEESTKIDLNELGSFWYISSWPFWCIQQFNFSYSGFFSKKFILWQVITMWNRKTSTHYELNKKIIYVKQNTISHSVCKFIFSLGLPDSSVCSG